MEFDNSVSLTTDRVLNITSELGPEEFAAKVLAAIPSDVKSGNLGCGRILADYSIMIQTRYILCDIYEEGPENLEDSDQPIGKKQIVKQRIKSMPPCRKQKTALPPDLPDRNTV